MKMVLFRLGLALAALLGAALPATASDAALCHAAAREAAARTGVPEAVLLAISLTETGTKRDGRFDAWPWTVNMEGKGVWFDTREQALAYALDEQARGARSFDLGCFQLNHRWHGEAFRQSVEAMFDPVATAMYAAKFLGDLYAETGSWEKAAGLYHSRTPDLAAKYAGLFAKHLRTAEARAGAPLDVPDLPLRMAGLAADATPRVNDYPLLQRGHSGQMGSLVPLSLFGRRAGVTGTGADASL